MKHIVYKKGLVIAGPCSAESELQLLNTARQLAKLGDTDILRAGIWKPRTTPGGFEGVGTKGLMWLLKAKQETGLKTAVEVATPKHVEDALQFDVDVLWIGARTSANPFSVQDIADALRGTDKAILIKNPVNPDLKLWMGAVERIKKAGVNEIGLIHRGFTLYGNNEYRNAPIWQIPVEMKRLLPGLPLLCDPSHICGNKELLLSVSQKSIDLDYDGLMIESHVNPAEAFTDKEQQLTPYQLHVLMNNLTKKSNSVTGTDDLALIDNLREQINYIDDDIIKLISDRMKLAKQIGEIKKSGNITILQSNRYNEIILRAIRQGKAHGLSENFIESYMSALHTESLRLQEKILAEEKEIVFN